MTTFFSLCRFRRFCLPFLCDASGMCSCVQMWMCHIRIPFRVNYDMVCLRAILSILDTIPVMMYTYSDIWISSSGWWAFAGGMQMWRGGQEANEIERERGMEGGWQRKWMESETRALMENELLITIYELLNGKRNDHLILYGLKTISYLSLLLTKYS